MRNICLSLILILLIYVFFPLNSFSQNKTQYSLPFGVNTCLGKGQINDIAFYPDSRSLAIASDSGIWKHNINTVEETTVSEDWIEILELSADGSILASVESFWQPLGLRSMSDKINLLDTVKGTTSSISTEHRDGIKSIGLSPDGRTLASGGEGTIQLWDTDTSRFLSLLRGHTDTVWKLVFSNDGKVLASGGADMTIRLWNVQSGQQLLTIDTEYTGRRFAFSFSSDGKTLVSGNQDGIIHLWDTRTGRMRSTFKGHSDTVTSLAFSPNGKTLASGGLDNTICLWNVQSTQRLQKMTKHTDAVYHLAFSSDGIVLASSSKDQTLRFWKVQTGKQLTVNNTGHWGPITALTFSHNGNVLASISGDWDKRVYLWDTKKESNIYTLKGHESYGTVLAFSKDDKILACGYEDGTILLFDTLNGRLLSTLTEHTMNSDPYSIRTGIDSIVFHSNDEMLASASPEKIVIYDVKSGLSLSAFKNKHINKIEALVISSNITTLAYVDSWKNLCIFDLKTNNLLKTINLEVALSKKLYSNKHTFSTHGTTLLGIFSWQDQSLNPFYEIQLWDVQSGNFLKSIPLSQSKDASPSCVNWTISTDWTTIVGNDIGSFDTIHLWDARTGIKMPTIKSNWSSISTLALSSDGRILATGYRNGTILLRDIRE